MSGTTMPSNRVRLAILAAAVALVLTLINVQITQKERLLRDGTPVLLRLAPVDPRSLMQGDYMSLRYAMARPVAAAAGTEGLSNGTVVIELDEQSRARFVDLYRGQDLGERQYLLEFRKRGDTVRLASDAFFFEEGRGNYFAAARFGELRVGANGDAILVGLRDADARPL